MSNIDDHILNAIRADNLIKDNEIVVEAALIYVVVDADRPKSHKYGQLYLGGDMPHHSALGLAYTWIDKLTGNEEEDNNE